MLWNLIVSATLAQSPAPPEPPLAIRADRTPSFESMVAFRDEHLSVRQVRHFIPGSTALVTSGWGYGPRPYWGWGWRRGAVVRTTPTLVDAEWAVFEGSQRITVPAYLQAIGDSPGAEALQRRIQRSRSSAKALTAVGWLGVIGGVATAIVANVTTDDFDESRPLRAASFISIGVGSVSLLVGGGQRSRARSLTTDFDRTLTLTEVREEVRTFNTELMERLDLTPEEALRGLDRSQASRTR